MGLTGADICNICDSTTGSDPTNAMCALDCDGDGEDNATECTNGTDPIDPCDNSYTDGSDVCAAIAGGADFGGSDCDGGGVDDVQECADGTDPTNPCDDLGLNGNDVCADITNNGSSSVFYGVDCDNGCLLYTSPSPRDKRQSRMPSSA